MEDKEAIKGERSGQVARKLEVGGWNDYHHSCGPYPRSRKPLTLKPEACTIMCVKKLCL